jgi:hypothetical protein
MSFFGWFTQKPVSTASGNALTADNQRKTGMPLPLLQVQPAPAARPQVVAGGADSAGGQHQPPGVERKVKRHARREQLYVAIRESMTRAGMLSASYKFKVLSLDQNGDQFLVMMDIASELGASTQKLTATEDTLVQTAKAGYGIVVTAVYWRVDPRTIPKQVQPPVATAPLAATSEEALSAENATVAASTVAASLAVADVTTQRDVELYAVSSAHVDAFAKTQANPPYVPEVRTAQAAPQHHQAQRVSTPLSPPTPQIKPRNDALLEAEVAAFKRALAYKPPTAASPYAERQAAGIKAATKGHTVSKSYTLITGFEDTEMPDSPAMPALSATQYGELS